MREILFRGKRIDTGEWVNGAYMAHDHDGHTIFNQNPEDGTLQGFEVIPETVGQDTGLKDKNGKKVFEGDIVACGDGKVPTEIRWVQESSAFMAYNLKRKEYHLLNKYFDRFIGEVIGSVHDNPELVG